MADNCLEGEVISSVEVSSYVMIVFLLFAEQDVMNATSADQSSVQLPRPSGRATMVRGTRGRGRGQKSEVGRARGGLSRGTGTSRTARSRGRGQRSVKTAKKLT